MKQLSSFAGRPVGADFELFNLATEPEVPTTHVYMEAQVFSPDSRRVMIIRGAMTHPKMSIKTPFERRVMLCDLVDGTQRQIGVPKNPEAKLATTPLFSPDGKYIYYFLYEGDRLRLMREDSFGGEPEQVGEMARMRAAGGFTISSDGARIALGCELPPCDGALWYESGVFIFDLATGKSPWLILRGEEYPNLHLQYSRNPATPHALMVQHNHGCRHPIAISRTSWNHVAALDAESLHAFRAIRRSDDKSADCSGYGLDIHIISDDPENPQWQTLPIARDGLEFAQGHQCWRGRTSNVISSNITFISPGEALHNLIEMEAFPGAVHCGNATFGGKRNVLSRDLPEQCGVNPHFLHFATDIAGTRIVSDYEAENGDWDIYLGELPPVGSSRSAHFRRLFNIGPRETSPWHPHPFLSPDGRWAFFNASEPNAPQQPYALRLK